MGGSKEIEKVFKMGQYSIGEAFLVPLVKSGHKIRLYSTLSIKNYFILIFSNAELWKMYALMKVLQKNNKNGGEIIYL